MPGHDLPTDFKQFLADLGDPDTARDFIQQILLMGYDVEEMAADDDVRDMSDAMAIMLAQSYWPLIYLAEYPSYGEMQ